MPSLLRTVLPHPATELMAELNTEVNQSSPSVACVCDQWPLVLGLAVAYFLHPSRPRSRWAVCASSI